MITGKKLHFLQRLAERGYLMDDVQGCVINESSDEITVDETHADYPRENRRIADAMPEGGPGTELKVILHWLGITPSEGCACNVMASRMNTLGPDWCESEAGMGEILSVMRAEHAKRLADGRTRLPWTDFGAKQLVRLACRRARAAATE